MLKFENFETNFKPCSDACILFNVQPIDLKLKTLVVLDFNDHLCSFLCWRCRTGAVRNRHLGRGKRKVQRVWDQVMNRYKLFRRRRELLCK